MADKKATPKADVKKKATNKLKSSPAMKKGVSAMKEGARRGVQAAKAPGDSIASAMWGVSPDAKDRFDGMLAFLKNWFFPGNWEDGVFMDDVRQATLRGAHPAANLLFWVIAGLFLLLLTWASFAYLDEVTTGQGKVVPSSEEQVIQNLEGGIIQEILVKTGDVVEKGQVLIRIDDTGFASSYGEKQLRYYTLQAAIARLEAEINEEKPQWPLEVSTKSPDTVKHENALYLTRKEELQSAIDILQRQAEQKEQELKEAQTRADQMGRTYEIAKKELDLTRPLEKEGVVSKVELLRVEREVNDLLGEKERAELVVPRAQTAIREANTRIEEIYVKHRSEALKELNEKRDEFSRLSEVMKAVEDQVARTTVRAPVRGTIKRLLVNTVGGVVQPGMDLVEMIPLDDTLLVKAKIRPKDIAFLRPGQKAQVKITAYDFSIYGGLSANLEQIGVDTVTDERGDAFYEIYVRTEKNYLGREAEPLPIIPGMVATVDILTGKKTVLDYILKPFIKMRDSALREK